RFSESGTLLFASSISDQSVYVFLCNNGVLTPAPGSPYAVAGRAGRMRLSSSQNAICRDYDRRNPIFNFWTALVRSLRELNWEAHRRGETDRSSRYPRNTPEIQSRYGTARCTRGSVYSADRCTRNTQLLRRWSHAMEPGLFRRSMPDCARNFALFRRDMLRRDRT